MYFTLQILEYNCQSGYESSDEHQLSPLCNTNFPAAQIKLSVQVGVLALSFGYFSYIHFQQDNTDTAGIEVGDQGSLSSFHRDIGIPNNFQEESSLVNLV